MLKGMRRFLKVIIHIQKEIVQQHLGNIAMLKEIVQKH